MYPTRPGLWTYVGLNSFGGPAGQIGVMHDEVVERRQLVADRQFTHALNYSMLLPGPEAQQLATYLGWQIAGVRGGLVAGWLFVLPGASVMLLLSLLYVHFGQVDWINGLLFGLQAAVIAIVVQAVLRMSARTLRTPALRVVAVSAFVALFCFSAPFPLVVLLAGLVGWWIGRVRRNWLPAFAADGDRDDVPPRSRRSALLAAGAALAAWLGPLLTLILLVGRTNIFTEIAVLFSKTAVLSFGGAYAGLAYVAQEVVSKYQWLMPAEMTTGLALAETTPGPLVLVLQFVGFLAAYHEFGVLAGIGGAVIALWMTFLPCFVFVFAGAPYMESLRNRVGLHNALSGVGAAVVGVIANLALWFALNTFFTVQVWTAGPLRVSVPELGSWDPAAMVISLVAGVMVLRYRLPTALVLAVCALLGVAFLWLR